MATYNTAWENSLFAEMNRARTQPKAIAAELESLRASYDGVLFKFPDGKVTRTTEGVAALNNAIAFLNAAVPVPAFTTISEGLSHAACDLVSDAGALGAVSNILSDGTPPAQRWVRYGQWKGKIGENIFFSIDDPRQIVYQWLIDDGNGNRPNRTAMLHPNFSVVGIAHGPHTEYAHMVVVTFALNFVDGGPGVVPSVGQNRDGKHTVQSSDRKTEESTLSAKGEVFEINTDDLQANGPEGLMLSAKGKVLTLSKTFKEGGKTKRKNMQWQLPFSFVPTQVKAVYANGEVCIRLPKPNPAEMVANANVLVGEYRLEPPTPANEKLAIDVKKATNKFILTVTGSSQPENVTVSFQGDMFIFSGTKIGGSSEPTNLPVRLPFLLSRELIEILADSQKIIARISKPGTSEAVNIPIEAA